MRMTLAYLIALVAAVAGACSTLAPPGRVPAPAATQLTSADGTKIWAQAQGNKSGPHVIFTHGIASDSGVYDDLFEREDLNRALYLVRYDQRGLGRSGHPNDTASYESKLWAQDVAAVVNAFGLHEPYFASWSLGSDVATDIAAYWPSPLPFSGFIHMAPIPYLTPEGLGVINPLGLSMPGLFMSNDSDVALASRMLMAENFSVQGARTPWSVLKEWAGGAMVMTPLLANRVFQREQDPTRYLEEVGKGFPVLHLHGVNDTLVNATLTQALLSRTHTNLKTYMYANTGHAVFYDQEDQVAKDILAYVTGKPAHRASDVKCMGQQIGGQTVTLLQLFAQWGP